MATWPSDVLDFCVPRDASALQPKDELEQQDFVYAVRLTLEDPTARLHVFLYGEDAVRLLGLDDDSTKIAFKVHFIHINRFNNRFNRYFFNRFFI